MAKGLGAWLTDRWPWVPVWKAVVDEDVPGGTSYFYSLGSAVLFIFIVQAVTGVFQAFYYVPTVDHAYDSVNYLRTQIPLGWLIHGLHYWGAQAMVVLAALHLSQVFIWGAHKKPREFTWILGVSNLLLVLAMSFTGAALPWDVKGFWATEVGTSIAGTVPLIGDFVKRLLRGAEDMGQLALDRMFATHVLAIPLLLALSVLIHIVAMRRKHAAGPWSEAKRRTIAPFWPDQLLKDVILSSVVLVVLVVLSVWTPAPTTGPADATDLSVQPKPEWDFLFLYQFIKAFKGPFEPIGTVVFPTAAVIFLFVVPFLSRREERNPLRRPVGMGLFLAAWAAIIALTISGALSHPGQGPSAAPGASAPAGGKAGQKPGGPAGASEGASLFQSMGCVACHKVDGRGGAAGPDLSNEGGSGRDEVWLADQIKNPKSHDPQSIMPAFGSRLSSSQLKSLAEYLLSLKNGSPAGKPAEEKPAAKETSPGAAVGAGAASKPAAPAPQEKAGPAATVPAKASAQAQSQGASLFKSEGCVGCHKINGAGGSVGPDLSDEGGIRSADWLAQQIKDPKSHNPQSIMPAFASKLDPARIGTLASYLAGLKEASPAKPEAKPSAPAAAGSEASEKPGAEAPPVPNVPGAGKAPGAPEASEPGPASMTIGDAGHGAILFQQTCVRCHGPMGTDKVPNPGSDDGTVPPLNPIDPAFKSADPGVFASNIDRFIQHGSVPDGPSPTLKMLPFGDSNTLTQQAIANVEAYVLSLNGVDRAKIVHPGIPPKIFVLATVFCFVVAGWVLWLLVPIKRKRKGPAER